MDMIVLDELRGDSTDLAIIILPDNTAKQHHKAALVSGKHRPPCDTPQLHGTREQHAKLILHSLG